MSEMDRIHQICDERIRELERELVGTRKTIQDQAHYREKAEREVAELRRLLRERDHVIGELKTALILERQANDRLYQKQEEDLLKRLRGKGGVQHP